MLEYAKQKSPMYWTRGALTCTKDSHPRKQLSGNLVTESDTNILTSPVREKQCAFRMRM